MKRFLLLALVLIMALASTLPVLAAPDAVVPPPKGAFSLVGRITALGENTVTVKVWSGNTLVQKYWGKELTITVTDATRYFFKQGTVLQSITFSDLQVGQRVAVNGYTANDVWKAYKITVTGGKFALVGKITAIGENTFTVKVWRGNTLVKSYLGKELTITVTDATLFFVNQGAAVKNIAFSDLQVGQQVNVNGYVANNVWKAIRVIVTGGKFALVGKITAIGEDTVTVKVWRGNTLLRGLVGKEVTIKVTDKTLLYRREGTVVQKITFADLKVGQQVSVNGYVANNIWTAYRITVVVCSVC